MSQQAQTFTLVRLVRHRSRGATMHSMQPPDAPQPQKGKPMSPSISVSGKRGIDLLHDPVLNKATAYTEAERQALGLVGLVPDVTESEDIQLRRLLQQLD